MSACKDSGTASVIKEWHEVGIELWQRLNYRRSDHQPTAEAIAAIVHLQTRFRRVTDGLARLAEQRGIDSSPYFDLMGNVDGADDRAWDAAWTLTRRLATVTGMKTAPLAAATGLSVPEAAQFLADHLEHKKPDRANVRKLIKTGELTCLPDGRVSRESLAMRVVHVLSKRPTQSVAGDACPGCDEPARRFFGPNKLCERCFLRSHHVGDD